MRIISTDNSPNFVQDLWSRFCADVDPPETEQERLDGELRKWVGKLEAADKVGAQQSLLRDLPRLFRPPPSLCALASVTNLRAGGKEKPRASAPAVEEESTKTSLRVEKTVVHFDIDPSFFPTSSTRRQLLTSFSSPSRPTHLPALAPTPPPSSPKPANTLSSPTSAKRPMKRPRASCPSILPSPLPTTVSASADIPLSPNRRIRRRYTLSAFSSPSIVTTLASRASSFSNLSSPLLPNPYDDFAWSFGISPTLGSSVPTPGQPFLDSENYFLNPLDVLWCAGWLPIDRSVAYEGPRRTGYIFVEGGQVDVEMLQEKRGSIVQGKGSALTVWIVDRSALETSGDWEKEGLLSVF
jgi:hypothetical protein